MAISDTQYTAWLKEQDSIRCILVEVIVNVSGVETTRYLSSRPYSTESAESPANTAYLSFIKGGVNFTESVDLDGSAGLSFGDIELDNSNWDLDNWLADVWVNREIKVFVGDVRWARADFRPIFDGIVDDIDSKSRDVLNINIRDKLQRLNTPVSEQTLGGTSINQDKLLPVLLGECFNISPLLVDEATLEYQIHDGAIEDIIEVRDNGVPVSFTKDLPSGKFTLLQNPSGQITCSAQGDVSLGYRNTVAGLVELLATGYGKLSDRFTAADIDATNFSQFDAANQQPVGLYIVSRTNTLNAINQLTESLSAQALMSRAGKLRIIKIQIDLAVGDGYSLLSDDGFTLKSQDDFFLLSSGGVTSSGDVIASDMKASSLKIGKTIPVKSAIKIGFCKNWTPQPDLLTGIPQEHKDLFADEWASRTTTDGAIATLYKLDNEPEQKDTLLISDTDAATESNRLVGVFREPRKVYEFDGYADLIELDIGDIKTIYHNRFGLSGGSGCMITKIQIDWINFQVKVGVLS